MFSRTRAGLGAEHLFYPDQVVVYVEGHSDTAFYEEALRNCNCRIIPKGGRPECEKLGAELIERDLPFVVVLDGDYGILERRRSRHRRIVLLHRYSFENYLLEREVIEQFCRDRFGLRGRTEIVRKRFCEVSGDTALCFRELTALDVAHRRRRTGCTVLPRNPGRFLKGKKRFGFVVDEVRRACGEARRGIDEQSLVTATGLVDRFLRERRLIDLLPGHFALGIIRMLVISCTKRSVSEEEIRPYLARQVWGVADTRDHSSLRRRLRRAVHEAGKMPRPGSGLSAKG